MSVTVDEARAALAGIYDPCSVAAHAPLSILDMGMVSSLVVSGDGEVEVRLRPTTLACMMITGIMQVVDEQLSALPGVTRVKLDIDRETPWSEDMLSAEGRSHLQAVRARSKAAVARVPQEWRVRGRAMAQEKSHTMVERDRGDRSPCLSIPMRKNS